MVYLLDPLVQIFAKAYALKISSIVLKESDFHIDGVMALSTFTTFHFEPKKDGLDKYRAVFGETKQLITFWSFQVIRVRKFKDCRDF